MSDPKPSTTAPANEPAPSTADQAAPAEKVPAVPTEVKLAPIAPRLTTDPAALAKPKIVPGVTPSTDPADPVHVPTLGPPPDITPVDPAAGVTPLIPAEVHTVLHADPEGHLTNAGGPQDELRAALIEIRETPGSAGIDFTRLEAAVGAFLK